MTGVTDGIDTDGCSPGELDAERERRWFAELEGAMAARGEFQFGPMHRRYTDRLMEACRVAGSPAEGARARYRIWADQAKELGIGPPPRSMAEPPPPPI